MVLHQYEFVISEDYTIPIPWRRIGYSTISFIFLISLYLFSLSPQTRVIVYLTGAIVGSYYFAVESIEHVFVKNKVTTDVIMMISIIGAAILGEFEESLTIVFLYSITETLESYTVKRTRSSINSLIELVPKEVVRIDNGSEKSVLLTDIEVNDLIRINVGDIIPTDGEIRSNHAVIDESTITGEPIPVFKSIGDQVLSGTSCVDGTFVYEVKKLPAESTVSQIINLVEEAQSHKVPVQLTIEKFTKYYNPGILIFALLVFVIPTLITGSIITWAILSITLLVASSPCALAISSPVTMYSAISTAASKGILVKGGVYLEELGVIEAVVFDKTGTLTYGEPLLTDIIPTDDWNRDQILQIAGSLELYSNHPLAKAVIKQMKNDDIKKMDVEDHSTIPGQGVSATISGEDWFIGYKMDKKFREPIEDQIRELKSKGRTIAFLQQRDEIKGIFGFSDKVRQSAVEGIKELRSRNIPVYMLTGDNKESAESIADQLAISRENVFYSMSPQDKMDKIKELKKIYKLAMIGDGINDAPSLALADIGIAMGIAGTDVALETADIAIMSDELPQLVKSINIGKSMKSTIIQNIIFSTTILAGLLIGVILGHVNITQAILIHEGTEVLIVLNAMKLFFRSF